MTVGRLGLRLLLAERDLYAATPVEQRPWFLLRRWTAKGGPGAGVASSCSLLAVQS